MPQSDPYNIPWIIQLIKRVNPNSILDIGIGNGTYGFLLRQWLDIGKGRLKKEQWEVKIDGIEIFEDYRNPIWEYFYDDIIIENALSMRGKIANYDVILLSDVIEHFTKSEGCIFIECLIQKTKYLIISTPKNDYPQGEVFGNIHETHLSKWDSIDFENYYCKTIKLNDCYVFVLCKEKENIDQINLAFVPHLCQPSRQLRTLIKNIFSEIIYDVRLFLEFRNHKSA